MRILLSAYACEAGRGSEPGTGWNWALALHNEGHRVSVLTRPACEPANSAYLRAHPEVDIAFKYVEPPRSTAIVRRVGSFGRVYGDYVAWQRAAARRATELGRFDVVHHVSWTSALFGSPMGRLGIPFVFGPVGAGQLTPTEAKSIVGAGWRRERFRNAVVRCSAANPLLRRTVRAADLVLATNSDTLSVVRSAGARDARLFLDSATLPLQLDPPPVRHHHRSPVHVVWIGGAYPRKALPLALEAVALARRKLDLRLTLAGGGPGVDAVPTLLASLGLDDIVQHIGEIPWAEVQQLLRTADVFLFTSVRDSFGSQVIEAAAAGLPIVALDLHGIADHVPDAAAWKVPLTTPAQAAAGLADALVDLGIDHVRRQAMGRAARAFAEEHAWREHAGLVSRWYEELVVRKRDALDE